MAGTCECLSSETLTDAARSARGLHPLELLARGGRRYRPEAASYEPTPFSPELHVLDYEWYFTSESSASLAGMVAGKRPCLLGTPTVAQALAAEDFVLVDRSPYLLNRFPSLDPARLRNVDIAEWESNPGHGAVLLDPPWYAPMLADWLEIALKAVNLDGIVLLPLLGEKTRPSASRERDRVLEFLESTGSVELLPNAIEYDIPLFEARALAARGVSLSGPWRLADLAVTHVSRRPGQKLVLSDSSQEVVDDKSTWTTFNIGTQVVKLRSSPAEDGETSDLLEPVPGVTNYTLDSVSQRDARICQIDIWSSRNRVARAANPGPLSRALRIAEMSKGRSERLETQLRRQGQSDKDIRELLIYLEMG